MLDSVSCILFCFCSHCYRRQSYLPCWCIMCFLSFRFATSITVILFHPLYWSSSLPPLLSLSLLSFVLTPSPSVAFTCLYHWQLSFLVIIRFNFLQAISLTYSMTRVILKPELFDRKKNSVWNYIITWVIISILLKHCAILLLFFFLHRAIGTGKPIQHFLMGEKYTPLRIDFAIFIEQKNSWS